MIVRVTNFQSIEDASLEVQGFTALVGRSNIGKSAIVRAVKAALTGTPSTSFVRHAADCPRKVRGAKSCKCQCTVHLKGEGFDLLWEKGDAVNRYTFNGQVYDKAERGTPTFLQPAFASVKIGDDKELLQVSDQFNPIFLLDQTGGVVADVLSDVAHLDRINVAIRMVEKDRRDAGATRKVREQDVVTLTQALVPYDGLDAALRDVRAVEDRLEVLEAAERRWGSLLGFIERGSVLDRQITLLTEAFQIVAPLPAPLRQALQKHTQLTQFTAQVSDRVGAIRTLQSVEGVRAPDPSALTRSRDRLAQLDGWVARIRTFKVWMERLKVLEAAPQPQPQGLTTQTETYVRLRRWVEQYQGLEGKVTNLTQQSEGLRAEGEALQAEWAALGVCPTCTQPFHPDGHVGTGV